MAIPFSFKLILCNLAVWALALPLLWFVFGHHGHDELTHAGAALEGKPWAKAVLDAVEGGLLDAAAASSTELAPPASLRPAVLAKIRALVAEEFSKGQAAEPSLAPSEVLTEECKGYGPVSGAPVSQLNLPVLDSLGGKVGGNGSTASPWGVPMPNLTVEVSPGRNITLDEVVYGYDLFFEAMHLFSYVSWGRVPMQQDPNDALAIADLIGRVQPDCFVELGTNTGGGAIFYAEVMKGYVKRPLVVTIDVHVPTKNWDRFAQIACPHCVPVTCHPTWHEPGLIEFVQGYTQDPSVVKQVEDHLSKRQCKRVMVMHDSDHRGEQVTKDTAIYHKFVTVGSYLVVQDTKLSRMRQGRYTTMEAVQGFLKTEAGSNFVVDKTYEYLLFSHHHNGFMKRVK